MRPTTATINLAALKHNHQIARQLAPQSKTFAVIKADAYGHGAIQCAQALVGSADGFAVATVEEAVQLRDAKIAQPILVLSSFSQAEEVELLYELNLMPVLHSDYQIELLAKNNPNDNKIHCWLKVDSGMNRLGFALAKLDSVLAQIKNLAQLKVGGIMSHFASSDEADNDFTAQQINRFNTQLNKLDYPVSLANSAAILNWPNSHRQWNRPGIMLYGTQTLTANSDQFKLKPVMDFCSTIIATKSIGQGESVGYGQAFVAEEKMHIGLVACGYADGYPRSMPTGTQVIVEGQVTTTVGRVSMDTMMVDLTHIDQAQINSKVQLWGSELPVNSIAKAVNTIPYELLTGVSARVPRQYLQDGE